MRNTFTLVLLTLSLSLSAQSALFVGIGQDTSEVREYLSTRTYLGSISEDSLDLWVAEIRKQQEVKYRFHDGTLYAIEDIREYEDKQQAEEITRTCVEYLKLLDFDSKQLESSNRIKRYVAITPDKVVEFIQERDGSSERYTCTLKVTSRRYGPRMKTESFVASVNAY